MKPYLGEKPFCVIKGSPVKTFYMLPKSTIHDGGPYHIETRMDWFLFDNDLRHEIVNSMLLDLRVSWLTDFLGYSQRILRKPPILFSFKNYIRRWKWMIHKIFKFQTTWTTIFLKIRKMALYITENRKAGKSFY